MLQLAKVNSHEVCEQYKSALLLAFGKRMPHDVDNIISAATDSITDALKILGFIAMKSIQRHDRSAEEPTA